MKLRSFWHFNRISFFVLDFALLWGAVVCAFALSPYRQGDFLTGALLNRESWFVGYGLPFFMAVGLQLTGLQNNRAGFRAAETVAQSLAGVVSGALAFVVLHAVLEFSLVGRYILILGITYGAAFIVGSRMLVWKMADHQRRNLLIYGNTDIFKPISQELERSKLPIKLVTFTEPDIESSKQFADRKQLREVELYERAKDVGANEILIEIPHLLSPSERKALLYCTGMGMSVVDLASLYERELERVYVPGLGESWFWGYDPAYAHPVYFAAKRTLDITVGLFGLVVLGFVTPIIVVLIKIQDGGPVIYSQRRVGLNNQVFQIFKFRTMSVDAEPGEAQWATIGDSRVTSFGRFMRMSRLDEFPQFWNILKGEMSLIGPRPERPEMIEKIEKEIPYYRYRHLIKPGLTGWAQINFPYGASINDARQKLSYDLFYLKYGKITKDIHIVLRTIVAMVRGAR